MRIAIDVFWALVLMCMLWACISPSRFRGDNRFVRALNFAPAHMVLRVFCGMSGVLGIANMAARYDKPWLLTHLQSVPFHAGMALVLLVLWVLVGYAFFATRVQEPR